ncbi:uncharacterized protein SOCEGT47_010160 [Sorangium cellulosum]|uniref:Uncharacterized protein n=1 Tax=Sorangium cellulosum TaxID=56 RepID=A0A4P2PV26_SORCE|nr:hypothetical protein [Sorangium cellulosum]AUX20544.1 uncharacterized protein SOCEGT47_010160 [Sorangium cellulosum]
MTGRKKRVEPGEAFSGAVNACGSLTYRRGLQAIKKREGKGQIAGEDASKILGSIAIDDDCRDTHPGSSRWDYLVGYDRSNGVLAHYIEVHPAETSNVAEVEKKLDWLDAFLQEDARRGLAAFPREYHWVASGRINIPQHTPQYKKLQTSLRKRGLKGPVKNLVLT